MIRIDDEEENRGVRRQFFPFGNIIVGRDARRPAEPSVHLFSSERARAPGRFAHACPQSQRARFSSANHGPGNPENAARAPARFAHASLQSQ